MARDRWTLWACVSLFLVVFGARGWSVHYAGSDLPHWDQWFADLGGIIGPLADGSFRLMDLAAPQNEHRLLYTKALTLGLAEWSGRWEPTDGLLVSALVRAADLVCVFIVLGLNQPAVIRGILLLLLAGIGSLPIGVFNLLSGFQVQFFIGEPLMILALALLCGGRLTVERLASGAAVLLLALFNMATPLVTATAAGLVLTLRAILGQDRMKAGLTAAFLFIFAAFVFWTAPGQIWLKLSARSLPEFASVLVRLLAWPFPDLPALAILAPIPTFLLLARVVRGRETREWSWFLLALGVHGLVQEAAIAYARALSGGGFPQYRDGLWLRLAAGFVILAEALRPERPAEARRMVRICALWALGLGAALIADAAFRGAPQLERFKDAAAVRQPAFAQALQNGDLSEFEAEYRTILGEGSLEFFDHPSRRFAIPELYIGKLKEERRRLLPWLPAALVGATPSRLTQALTGVASLGPVFLILGLIPLFVVTREVARPPASVDEPRGTLE
ncbi:MAG: hypothetical protein ABI565_02715 [Vicinamibacteria bacterium]